MEEFGIETVMEMIHSRLKVDIKIRSGVSYTPDLIFISTRLTHSTKLYLRRERIP